jgi:hypothetical protein
MRQTRPSTQDSLSGRGDLPLACANLRDGAGSRRRSLLFVTQRSDQRRDRRLARVQFPFVTESLVKKPAVLREIFFAAANAAKFAISRWKLPVASDRVNFSQLCDD